MKPGVFLGWLILASTTIGQAGAPGHCDGHYPGAATTLPAAYPLSTSQPII
jgi:hypothetical protein